MSVVCVVGVLLSCLCCVAVAGFVLERLYFGLCVWFYALWYVDVFVVWFLLFGCAVGFCRFAFGLWLWVIWFLCCLLLLLLVLL